MFQISFHEGMHAVVHTQFLWTTRMRKKIGKTFARLEVNDLECSHSLKKRKRKNRKNRKIPAFWKLKIQICMLCTGNLTKSLFSTFIEHFDILFYTAVPSCRVCRFWFSFLCSKFDIASESDLISMFSL